MNVQEGLARQIRRVAELRGRYVGRCGGTPDCPDEVAAIDALLDQACRAIGSDDAGAIAAAGVLLEGVEE